MSGRSIGNRRLSQSTPNAHEQQREQSAQHFGDHVILDVLTHLIARQTSRSTECYQRYQFASQINKYWETHFD
jgi:hypothetical protein